MLSQDNVLKTKKPFKIHILTKKEKKGILGRAKNVEKLKKNIGIYTTEKLLWLGHVQAKKQTKEGTRTHFHLMQGRGHLKCHDNYLDIILKDFYFVTGALKFCVTEYKIT